MLLTNHAASNRADLRERTKTMHNHGDHRGQIADFWDSCERIKWLYLHSKCGIKTKTHFEWLLWHWSSLGQLNLEPTQPNGLVGRKVPTDLVKISAKEAMHMGFYYNTTLISCIMILIEHKQCIQHALTLKWLGHFFSKCDFIFWCCSPYVQYFYIKLVQYNECLVNIVDADGLVL